MDLLIAFILFMAVMLAALIKDFTMVIALLVGLIAFTAVGLKRGFGFRELCRMGAGGARIMFRHILPNTFPVLLSAVTIGFNNAVLSEASMSFLGIGIQPPYASLGSMLSDSQSFLHSAPWYALGTGGAIVLLILGFSLLSEGLQLKGQR